jgi:septum formation protein
MHRLATAVVALRDGARIWHHVETPRLRVRPFGEAFLDHYLAHAGDDLLQTVGAYAYESLGAQLFARVEGDHFTILGVPLLPLLEFLREQGLLPR